MQRGVCPRWRNAAIRMWPHCLVVMVMVVMVVLGRWREDRGLLPGELRRALLMLLKLMLLLLLLLLLLIHGALRLWWWWLSTTSGRCHWRIALT